MNQPSNSILPMPQFLRQSADIAAQKLLGCLLIRELEGHTIIVRIVETEAYDQDDPASHAYHGKSQRNRALFGPPGHLYVYFTYGMYYCANITCGEDGYGSGALIRAVEPIQGEEIILRRRHLEGAKGTKKIFNATNGPAKMALALDIDKRLYGHDLRLKPLQLQEKELLAGEKIITTTRIGISKEKLRQRRFYIDGNPYVSKVKSD